MLKLFYNAINFRHPHRIGLILLCVGKAPHTAHSEGTYRRRIYTDENAKVVAAVLRDVLVCRFSHLAARMI